MSRSDYESGYNAGYADGFARAREQYAHVILYLRGKAAADPFAPTIRDNTADAMLDAIQTGTGVWSAAQVLTQHMEDWLCKQAAEAAPPTTERSRYLWTPCAECRDRIACEARKGCLRGT